MKRRMIVLVVVLCVGMLEFQHFTKTSELAVTEHNKPQPVNQNNGYANSDCGKSFWVDELSKNPSVLDIILPSDYDPNDGHKRAQLNGVENVFVTLTGGDYYQSKLRMSILLRAMGISPLFVPKVTHGRAPLLVALDHVIKHDTTALIVSEFADLDKDFVLRVNNFTATHPKRNREILWLSECSGLVECGYGFIVNKNGALKMKDEFVRCAAKHSGKTALAYPKGLDTSSDLIVVAGPLEIKNDLPTFPNSITGHLYKSIWLSNKKSDLLMLNV